MLQLNGKWVTIIFWDNIRHANMAPAPDMVVYLQKYLYVCPKPSTTSTGMQLEQPELCMGLFVEYVCAK